MSLLAGSDLERVMRFASAARGHSGGTYCLLERGDWQGKSRLGREGTW